MNKKLNTEPENLANPLLSDVLDFTDCEGKELRLGDKVRGVGYLTCQGGFKIDLSPIVTISESFGTIYFGGFIKK